MSLSWIFEFGCCFCGCDNKEDFSKANDPFYIRSPSNRVIDKQVSSKGYSRFQYKESEPLISSTSCSGYQSYLACTESSDADDERSVDIRHNLRSKLNAVTEEETPRVKQHSNDQDEEDSQAELTLSLAYDEKLRLLHVTIVNCRHLPVAYARKGDSNPYVQVCLLPDPGKKNRRKTKVRYSTIHPDFYEQLPPFELAHDQVEQAHLRVYVFHSSQINDNSNGGNNSLLQRVQSKLYATRVCLGEAYIPLTHYLLRRPQRRTYPLTTAKLNPFLTMKSSNPNITNLGNLRFSLKFVPRQDYELGYHKGTTRRGSKAELSKLGLRTISPQAVGSLEIKIIAADSLPLRESGAPPKPYCKIFLFSNHQATGLGLSNGLKQTTPIENSTQNPQWNHPIAYHNLTLQILSECCLEISVWDDFKFKSNEFIGGIRLSLINSPFSNIDTIASQHSYSLSLDTRKDHIFDSLDIERQIWSQLIAGDRFKTVDARIPLRNFTPYDKIRLNFGAACFVKSLEN